MNAVLEIEGLRKRYGQTEVLAGVDLSVQPGECFGLLGPNGAGKTTTLKLALGLGQADGGQVRLLGHPVPEQAPQARRRVGVVPQFDNLDPDFTCAENLVVYGRYFGLPREVIEQRIGPLMEFAGLQGREDARLDALSGGMKRRLTMARALVNDPDVVFMDEPTTGLDPQARHLIWERLRHLRSQGKTLILTTHFMEEAQRLCTRLLVMDGGRVIATGTPRELIAAHIEPQVLEVHGAEVARWAEAARPGVPRLEVVGETAFCYAQDVSALQDSLRNWPELACLHRPANLEDVFLKLTGRELRD
jgi:lipooligosaccharide transport system ATP-binding protein